MWRFIRKSTIVTWRDLKSIAIDYRESLRYYYDFWKLKYAILGRQANLNGWKV